MKLRVDDIVVEARLYPRMKADKAYIRELADALAAGEELPPIVVERESNRLVDGYHRLHGHRLHGDDEVVVQLVCYEDDAEFFLDSLKRNARQGRRFGSDDIRLIVQIATKDLKIEPMILASGLAMTKERLSTFKVTKRSWTGRGGTREKPAAGALDWGTPPDPGASRHTREQCVDALIKAVEGTWWPNDHRTQRQLKRLFEVLNYRIRKQAS